LLTDLFDHLSILDTNRLTAIPPHSLATLANLNTLILTDNNITYIDPDMHAAWGHIDTVMMIGNPSVCLNVLPLRQGVIGYDCNTTSLPLMQATKCNCAPGYSGIDYCIAQSDAFILRRTAT
jgi:hypothetical protein